MPAISSSANTVGPASLRVGESGGISSDGTVRIVCAISTQPPLEAYLQFTHSHQSSSVVLDLMDSIEALFNGSGEPIPVWVDCDTGHDDAFAILLAAQTPAVKLLGVSTVHGNSSLENTTYNSLSVLEAIGRRDVPVYPGAGKPFCRPPVYAGDIHGESGLDGTLLLPKPVAPPRTDVVAVEAMYRTLISTPPNTAFLVATGALTNVALLLTLYPAIVSHLRGLSIMGGAIGGLFTNAPMGRIKDRAVFLKEKCVHNYFNGRLPEEEILSTPEVVKILKEKDLVGGSNDNEEIGLFVDQARKEFGNVRPMSEFNIAIDPESSAAVFLSEEVAAKTTLIPLDLSHQAIATKEILSSVLHGSRSPSEPPSKLRQMFYDLLTFYADTYMEEFGMYEGPPLHDPITLLAVIAPHMLHDNGGERFDVRVFKGDNTADLAFGYREDEAFALSTVLGTNEHDVQLGRTLVRPVKPGTGRGGVTIPRGLDVAGFWKLIGMALDRAEQATPMK